MRYSKIVFGCATLLIGSVSTQAAPLSSTGQDNRLEWEVQSSWKTAGQPMDIVHSLDGKLVFILNNEHQVLVYDEKGDLQGRIPVGDGVTAIDIAPQGESLYLVDKTNNTFTSLAMNYVYDLDISGSPFKGMANAPVTLTVFTDFECPYCGKLVPLLEQVLKQNKETVKIVFKNMPLQFHKLAQPAHQAALAAEQQGKFWEFHDRLFAAKKLSNQLINDIAVELELDLDKFKNDMASPLIRQKINKDLNDARIAGVTGTPTVFINGRKLKQRSLQGFQQIIDDELKKLGK